MSTICHRCHAPLSLEAGRSVGRKEECAKCGADLHCCLNCRHYSPSSYNECAEPQAERVLDKDRSNFCDFFSPGGKAGTSTDRDDARKKLDDLFK